MNKRKKGGLHKEKRARQAQRTTKNQVKRLKALIDERPEHEHVPFWKKKLDYYLGIK